MRDCIEISKLFCIQLVPNMFSLLGEQKYILVNIHMQQSKVLVLCRFLYNVQLQIYYN